jgi:hypothetical protein
MVSISDYYHSTIEKIKREIDQNDENNLLKVNCGELTEYYLKKYGLILIEKDPSRKIELIKHKSPNYGRVVVDILYPILNSKNIFDRAHLQEVISMTASHYFSIGGPSIKLEGDWIKTVSEGETNLLKKTIANLEQVIEWKNRDVSDGNEKLKNQIENYIRTKQDTIKREYENLDSIIEEISVPIKVRRGEFQPVIDFSVKEELVTLIKPEPEKHEEVVLTSAQVATILKYIRNSCLSFEKTPRVFSKLEEEDLRDIILGNLNAIFEGNATSETFSKSGKTDIHLRITKGNILIMECKFWKGIEKYVGGLDQLFGYLTWRNNYAVLITFSRNKDCMEVFQKAKAASLRHGTFVANSLEDVGLGEFVTTHRFQKDSEKKVEVHHLIFDLFYKE